MEGNWGNDKLKEWKKINEIKEIKGIQEITNKGTKEN